MANDKNYQEPEEDQQNNSNPGPSSNDIKVDAGEQPGDHMEDDYTNPLSEAVTEKNYTRPNVNVTSEQLNTPIPEPLVGAQVIDLTTPPPIREMPKSEPIKEQAPFNPQMSQLPKKDKRDAAERAADAVLDGYAFLKGQSNYLIKINERQIKRMAKKGEINLTIPVPIDENGNHISLQEYIQEFNRQNDGLIEFSTEARAEIKPALVDYFDEIGFGMTKKDELIYLAVKEGLTFGGQLWQGYQIKKEMVKSLVELTAAYRASSQQQQSYTAPPPAHDYQQEDVITPDKNDGGGTATPGGVEVFEIITNDTVTPTPLAAMTANEAALQMTGAIQQQSNEPTQKKKPGRLTKAESEERKKLRVKPEGE